MWCVPMMPGSRKSSLSTLAGAAGGLAGEDVEPGADCFLSIAAASSAASSTTSAREVLTKMAPGFKAVKKALPTRPRVSGLRARCTLTTSAAAATAAGVVPTTRRPATPPARRRERPAPGHHLHAEGAPAGDHLAADRCPCRRPPACGRRSPPPGVLLLVPHPVAQVDGVVDQPPVERQDQRRGRARRRRSSSSPGSWRRRCRARTRSPRRWCWCPHRPAPRGRAARHAAPRQPPRCCAPPAPRHPSHGPRW